MLQARQFKTMFTTVAHAMAGIKAVAFMKKPVDLNVLPLQSPLLGSL